MPYVIIENYPVQCFIPIIWLCTKPCLILLHPVDISIETESKVYNNIYLFVHRNFTFLRSARGI